MLAVVDLEVLETLRWRFHFPRQSIGGISYIAATTPNEVNGALVKLFDIWEVYCKPCINTLHQSSNLLCVSTLMAITSHRLDRVTSWLDAILVSSQLSRT